jgi:hypothetical protein
MRLKQGWAEHGKDHATFFPVSRDTSVSCCLDFTDLFVERTTVIPDGRIAERPRSCALRALDRPDADPAIGVWCG